MKVFVAGATGVLGRNLVPQLAARGHEVVGMTRSASKQDLVRGLGARPVVVDALDPDAVAEAVASAEPEVIVHQLTALSGPMSVRDARHPERSTAFTMTNRLRTEATDHLLPAGRAADGAAGNPPRGAGGDEDRVGRGSRAALRRFLRSGDRHQPGSGCGDGGADPQASVPDRRRRWWRLVAHAHRRRGGGDRRRGRPRAAGYLQR